MPLDLRPLALGELFDRAFVLYRRHFSLFVGITAVPGVFALLMTLAQQALASSTRLSVDAANDHPEVMAQSIVVMGSLFVAMVVSFLIYWVVYMIALGATTLAVSEIYVGRPATIADSYGHMRGRIGSLLWLVLLITLRIGGLGIAGALVMGVGIAAGAAIQSVLGVLFAFMIAMVLFAACLFLSLRYSLSIPALVLEGLPAGQSIRRSIELTKGRLGRVLLMVICATVVTYAAVLLFQGPFFAAAMLSGMDTSRGFWLNVLGGIFGTVGATLTTPFLIIGLAVIYYDARIREEGFDLEMSLAALDA